MGRLEGSGVSYVSDARFLKVKAFQIYPNMFQQFIAIIRGL
jgi:hypothetical protein